MFHVEVHMGIDVVREFNLSEPALWGRFLAPLMEDHDFVLDGHEFSPRKTRIKILEGPELPIHQLGMGRGWQNAERKSTDVTEAVLARAREYSAAIKAGSSPNGEGRPSTTVISAAPSAGAVESRAPVAPNLTETLRERLIGRLSAGPVAASEILALTSELLPDAGLEQRLIVAQQAVWALLEGEQAQLGLHHTT